MSSFIVEIELYCFEIRNTIPKIRDETIWKLIRLRRTKQP